jgi:hypothetical protein
MGVKIALAAALFVLAAAPGFAQDSTEGGLRDCEKLAAVKFKQDNPAFKHFAIDRASVEEDKFTDKVGSQYVSTVYQGKASYQDTGDPQRLSFICLHAGFGKGAVFVYVLSH